MWECEPGMAVGRFFAAAGCAASWARLWLLNLFTVKAITIFSWNKFSNHHSNCAGDQIHVGDKSSLWSTQNRNTWEILIRFHWAMAGEKCRLLAGSADWTRWLPCSMRAPNMSVSSVYLWVQHFCPVFSTSLRFVPGEFFFLLESRAILHWNWLVHSKLEMSPCTAHVVQFAVYLWLVYVCALCIASPSSATCFRCHMWIYVARWNGTAR